MTPSIRLTAPVLGTPDPPGLARFYQRLLGWPIRDDEPDWATLRPADGSTGLSFQLEPDHVPPVWPPQPGTQQMQQHLDLLVDDLDAATATALEAGAEQIGGHEDRHERVHLDTTMFATDFTERGSNAFDRALLPRLSDLRGKVLLGSDFPSIPYAYAHQLQALHRLELGEDWLRAVLWHNGARLFRIAA